MRQAVEDLDRLLSRVPVAAAARAALAARLRGADRHYHGEAHILLLWHRHLAFGTGLAVREEPWETLIACAIAYHDAVHDPRRRDNEAASAQLWREARPGLPARDVAWVAGTILATADHLGATREAGMDDPAWAARCWMLDLDLTPIGEAPAAFTANTAQLRQEFAHLPQAEWDARRIGFLRGLRAAPRLFRTDALAAAFEGPARRNIARELGVPAGRLATRQ
jgi:predicted metal-dependent HD superfamily phosphohydrolase